VEGRGSQTKMPRAALPRSGQSGDAIVMLVSVGVASLFAAVQIAFAVSFTPLMLALYERAGQPLPGMLSLAQALGPFGIVFSLLVLDAVIFVLCVWAARRWWVGLLFAPPAIYVATTFGLFIGMLGGTAAAALAS